MDTEARINQWPDCGKKHAYAEASRFPNTKTSETEVEGPMKKWQSKKLIATTVSSREKVQRRGDERKIKSSEMHVMSTVPFAVLIPGMFLTPLKSSSSICWMSCCLFILFLSLMYF